MPTPLAAKGTAIMSDNSSIMRQSQLAMRREMDRRGIAMKAVSFDSGIPYSSLLSYFPGEKNAVPAVMPVSAFYALCAALPNDLLSLLLPASQAIVTIPENVDHDKLAEAFTDYLADKNAAHHPASECGPAIGPGENARLSAKVVQLPIVRMA
jgi:hypothetical protein